MIKKETDINLSLFKNIELIKDQYINAITSSLNLDDINNTTYDDAINNLLRSTNININELEYILKEYIENVGVRQFLLKSLYWEEKGKLALRFNITAIENNINMVGEPLFEDAVFAGETLFINGEVSGYIKPEDEELIHHHFPMARIHTILGAGHWVHAEAPEEFADISSRFLLGMFV